MAKNPFIHHSSFRNGFVTRPTKVTKKGVDRLQKALPKCRIVSDFYPASGR